jgi:N utilization substance protein B
MGQGMSIGGRRAARERAVCLLYEAEAKEITPGELLAELPAPPDPFAGELVRWVGANMARIDSLLAGRAIGWTLVRMPALDRNILRVGTYELLACPEVPTAVVISEAVELAKQYSTEESGRWVNGVLAGIARDVRPGEQPSPVGEAPEGYPVSS